MVGLNGGYTGHTLMDVCDLSFWCKSFHKRPRTLDGAHAIFSPILWLVTSYGRLLTYTVFAISSRVNQSSIYVLEVS